MKYRLLKDLPWVKAGEIMKEEEWSASYNINPQEFTDWFEPIPSRWKPKEGEENVRLSFHWTYYSGRGEKTVYDWDQFDMEAHYFKTQTQCKRASLKIKEALESFWAVEEEGCEACYAKKNMKGFVYDHTCKS